MARRPHRPAVELEVALVPALLGAGSSSTGVIGIAQPPRHSERTTAKAQRRSPREPGEQDSRARDQRCPLNRDARSDLGNTSGEHSLVRGFTYR
jgi:hypothetical protein